MNENQINLGKNYKSDKKNRFLLKKSDIKSENNESSESSDAN